MKTKKQQEMPEALVSEAYMHLICAEENAQKQREVLHALVRDAYMHLIRAWEYALEFGYGSSLSPETLDSIRTVQVEELTLEYQHTWIPVRNGAVEQAPIHIYYPLPEDMERLHQNSIERTYRVVRTLREKAAEIWTLLNAQVPFNTIEFADPYEWYDYEATLLQMSEPPRYPMF